MSKDKLGGKSYQIRRDDGALNQEGGSAERDEAFFIYLGKGWTELDRRLDKRR